MKIGFNAAFGWIACLVVTSSAYAGYKVETPAITIRILSKDQKPVACFPVLYEVNGKQFRMKAVNGAPIVLPEWEETTLKSKTFRADSDGYVVIPSQKFKSIAPNVKDAYMVLAFYEAYGKTESGESYLHFDLWTDEHHYPQYKGKRVRFGISTYPGSEEMRFQDHPSKVTVYAEETLAEIDARYREAGIKRPLNCD